MGLGDFTGMCVESMRGVGRGVEVAGNGFRGLFGGFNDLVRRT